MLQPLTVSHADPQASILPGTIINPAHEGQPKAVDSNGRPLAKGSHSLSTLSDPEPIRAARAILAGKLLLLGGIELDINLQNVGKSWPGYLFRPEDEVIDLSQPDTRNLLAELDCDGDQEEQANQAELSPEGREFARRICTAAAAETLEVLADLARIDESPREHGYKNCRLRARMCQAAREELAELVREWDEVVREWDEVVAGGDHHG